MRAALYWAPAPDDPLWGLGCRWLGRDAAAGLACTQPALPNIAALTEAPRQYGFHATLRPPMRVRGGLAAFSRAAGRVAQSVTAFALPPLELAELDGFLALRESAPCPGLRQLADASVALTDELRLPAAEEELQRRRAAGLSPRQDALLQRWGYPYVMEEWFFHLTLTRRLAPAERAAMRDAAGVFFADALTIPRRVEDICVFVQDGGDFRVMERIRLSKASF